MKHLASTSFFLLLIPLITFLRPSTSYAIEEYVYDYDKAYEQNRQNLDKATSALGKIEHDTFFLFRLGADGGVALHSNALYGTDDKLIGRANLNFSAGWLGIWPAKHRNSGYTMGVMINQQLGLGIRKNNSYSFGGITINSGSRTNFVGLTMVDFPFQYFFNSKFYFGLVLGLGIAYSDGGNEKNPLYFNDDFGAGAALAVKYSVEMGYFFTERLGIAFEIQYIFTRDSASHFEYGGYDEYSTTTTYYNSGNNILPTIELLIKI